MLAGALFGQLVGGSDTVDVCLRDEALKNGLIPLRLLGWAIQVACATNWALVHPSQMMLIWSHRSCSLSFLEGPASPAMKRLNSFTTPWQSHMMTVEAAHILTT